jgi:membrane-associated phospholipid phosphatase
VSLPALDRLRDFDLRATARLRAIPAGNVGRAALVLFAHSGDSLVLIPLLALLWWAQRFSRQSIAVPLIAGYLASMVITWLVKYTFRRRRPEGDWGALYRKTDPHSFPSGHASRTLTLTVVVLACDAILAGFVLAAWSLAVGFARVVLGVHFLLDVLAGYLLGMVIGFALWPWIVRGMPGLPQFPW